MSISNCISFAPVISALNHQTWDDLNKSCLTEPSGRPENTTADKRTRPDGQDRETDGWEDKSKDGRSRERTDRRTDKKSTDGRTDRQKLETGGTHPTDLTEAVLLLPAVPMFKIEISPK